MFLELSHLSKSFGSHEVIDDLCLGVEKGEVMCLLGASGCGKTTTLRLVGGFLAPDGGRVVIDGQDVTGMSPEIRPTATVFQSYALFPHMSVVENVGYGVRFSGATRAEAKQRAMEMLEAVGLSECASSRVQDISGGQQQRVALARALVLGPKVLLLDEPFSNLDANLRIRMREEVRQIQRRFGVTMVFVTHDREEAMSFADRLAIMRNGKILQVATPREAYDHPADLYCARFLGHVNELDVPGGTRFFRDEAVTLGKEGGVLGVVGDATYLGGYWRYELLVGESRVYVRAPANQRYARGATVPFVIDQTIDV